MAGIRIASLALLVAAGGCSLGQSEPLYPQQPAPQPPQTAWYGPPGGAMDPGYGYPDPAQGDGSYEGSYPPNADDPDAASEPSADPADPGYVMGDVTDTEIEATLDSSGEWVEDDDYGYVWLPYDTVVGEDFTPYDSDGEWAYTDYGWSFASDFDWGWLAFHYGNWIEYGDGGWGWVPGHTWGPAWCEWRHGGNAVGWRPTPPQIRDHRSPGNSGPWHPSHVAGGGTIRDHRTHKDPESSWHFAAGAEFGLRNRPTRFAQTDGMRVTTPVVRPPAGRVTTRAAQLMSARMHNPTWLQSHPAAHPRPAFNGGRAQRPWTGAAGGELGQSTAGGRPWLKPPSPWGQGPRPSYTQQQPQPQRYRPQQTWPRSPVNDEAWHQPDPRATSGGSPQSQPGVWGGTRPNPATNSTWGGAGSPPRPTNNPSSRPSWSNTSQPTYQQPQRPAWNGGTVQPTRPTWNGGSSGTYRAPARPSYNSGAGYSGGSRSSGSSGSYSGGGSRPSSSSSYSGGSRSYSSGSSRSYSSGSSGGSRSSGGGGSSRSSGGGGGGSRSSGGGGGGRHR